MNREAEVKRVSRIAVISAGVAGLACFGWTTVLTEDDRAHVRALGNSLVSLARQVHEQVEPLIGELASPSSMSHENRDRTRESWKNLGY